VQEVHLEGDQHLIVVDSIIFVNDGTYVAYGVFAKKKIVAYVVGLKIA
jgi:uncharacterized protein (UPF0218 family)